MWYMREFIGHKIKVAVEVLGVVEGVLADVRPTEILVKGDDGKITRVRQDAIKGYLPVDFEPFDYIPFHVLFCENKKSGCPGVQYVKEGEGFTHGDLEVFTSPCTERCEDCTMGTKGELRSVRGEFLRQMLAGTMFGDYPTKESTNGRAEHAAPAVAKGEGKGRGVLKGEKPAHG